MDELFDLVDLLSKGEAHNDIAEVLQSESTKAGLEKFHALLTLGVEVTEDGRAWLESWNNSQIQAVCSVASLIVLAVRSLSVAQVESIVVEVVHQSLELAMQYLERTSIKDDELSLQNKMVQLLESAFVLMERECDSLHQFSVGKSPLRSLIESVDMRGKIQFETSISCNIGGWHICSKEQKHIHNLIMILSSECLQSDGHAALTHGSTLQHHLGKVASLSLHLVVVHGRGIQRLLVLCKNLAKYFVGLPNSCIETKEDLTSRMKLALGLRILKLAVALARESSYAKYNGELLQTIVLCADVFPSLFSVRFDYGNPHVTFETSSENLVLMLVDEFVHLIEVTFYNSCVLQNIKAHFAASIWDCIDNWRYNRPALHFGLPLACFPHSAVLTLKLIYDIRDRAYHNFARMKNGLECDWCIGVHNDSSFSSGHRKKIYLLKKYAYNDLLEVVIHSPKRWVETLTYLVSFFYKEGVKLMPKLEREHCSSIKPLDNLQPEKPTVHDDEAIFGDLFAEAIHGVGYSNGSAAMISISSSCNLPIRAAAELLSFLKEHVSLHEWKPPIYTDCSGVFLEEQIGVFLSILNERYCFEDNDADGDDASEDHKMFREVHETSFKILHDLIVQHALSTSSMEYLIDSIVYSENGLFVYNVDTLALLAHVISSKKLCNRQLIAKLFKGFADFIIKKTRIICSEGLDIHEVLKMLPSVFHIEILMMAFYFSSQDEKVALASILYSSIKAVDFPHSDYNCMRLSCWAILVSRLIFLLHHMVVHPHTCPPSLLLSLQSKLNATTCCSFSKSNMLNECSLYWASLAVESVLDISVKQDPDIKNLIDQMIDYTSFPYLCSVYDVDCRFLQLNWVDLYKSFSHMLGLWKGMEAATAGDLIIERYIFALCCGILHLSTIKDHNFFIQYDHQVKDMIDMDFFCSSSSLLGYSCAINSGINFNNMVTGALQNALTVIVRDDVEQNSWDFLRSGFLLSLVLSSMDIGLQSKISLSSVSMMHHSPKDKDYVVLAEGLIFYILEPDKAEFMLRALSSLLNKYLQAYQKYFILCLDNEQQASYEVSPVLLTKHTKVLLLKHTEVDKIMSSRLLEKTGINSSCLEFYFDILKRLDVAVKRKASGLLSSIFQESMLHGFPSQLQTPSSTLLSCIINIRKLIGVLHGVFKTIDARQECAVDSTVFCQILNSLMIVKYDKVFLSLCENIEATYRCLTKGLFPEYGCLFLLKNMEIFLKDLNSANVIDEEIYEWIILKIVDLLDVLRKDSAKIASFNFYLGEVTSQTENELFAMQKGNVMVLMDSLDNCHSESVNVRVLNFMVDILSGGSFSNLKQKVNNKFRDMDLIDLSRWLEKRFLGHVVQSSCMYVCAKGSSFCLRESAMNFILCLVSPYDEEARKLRNHCFESMLLILDTAFMQFDIYTAKSFLNFVAHLAIGEEMIKSLLSRIVLLIGKLYGNENFFPGLQCLINFIGSTLGSEPANGPGAEENSVLESRSKTNIRLESQASRSIDSRKDSANVLAPSSQEATSTVECDVISMDEDEDEGTSEGEMASIDKNDEEEVNGGRLLSSKVCTFTSSGSNFMEQHWYFCYTCDLTGSKGCCSVCAKVCHRGHRVVYSRLSRFFCDCGAGGVRGSSCQCLDPRKLVVNNNVPVPVISNLDTIFSFSGHDDDLSGSDSDFDENVLVDMDNSLRFFFPKELQDGILIFLEDLGIEGTILKICSTILPSILSRRETNLAMDNKIVLGESKILAYSAVVLLLKKSYKSGSLDLKVKPDYSRVKDLKCNAARTVFKSLLSISSHGKLAVGEGDKVGIFDVAQLITQASITPAASEKTNIKSLSKNLVRFEIVHLLFNPVVENYLAVAGYEDCQILSLNSRGEVADRLPIELAIQGGNIKSLCWVPGSQVQLMIVTNKFVKIYDLSKDNISPIHYITIVDNIIADASLVVSNGKPFLFVLSDAGNLFKLELVSEENSGARCVEETIEVQHRIGMANGSSLFISSTYQLLFLSYQDGTTLIGRLSSDLTSLIEISSIHEDGEDKLRSAGLHHWKELTMSNGLFTCFSSLRSNAGIVVQIGSHEICAHDMCSILGSTSPVVGITYYKSYRNHVFALHEDGSLQVYTHVSPEADVNVNMASEKVKKLGSDILNCNDYANTNLEFPLDFFERTICITSDVKVVADGIKNGGEQEKVKQKLSSEDGFLEGSSISGFKITILNPNPDIAMVGFRVQVGNTSVNNIPSTFTIFKRVVKLDEGLRSWYDVPFTVTESLLADEEFTVTVGSTFGGSAPSRIDSLEVYGRAKDEFGWKEKVGAVLDMEARGLSGILCIPGSGKKSLQSASASIEEQVVSDGLQLLSRFYSLCRLRRCSSLGDLKADINELRCKEILELIFESDREPVLHAAAYCVLQAVFPVKEIYYQVKDVLRLRGVLKSTSMLFSKIGTCCAAGSSIIEEFIGQMHAVTKIAVRRRSNLASFLERNGSEVIDGLMRLLWGILNIELPETQTVNNIIVSSVELIYCYAECLMLHAKEAVADSVSPAVLLLKKLLVLDNGVIQASSSLAISSRLLQVPFPKQTMLVADGTAETPARGIGEPHSAGRTNQVVIEEDNITSSVQYCCDGCSTVPILRRRWHCTVCPDFDLCEACYEALDADRLPLPHCRDHPMDAMPIEQESVGGDGSEITFSVDESRESDLVSDVSSTHVQKSVSTVRASEPNASGIYTVATDTISISASKREVNSFILAELLEHMKGWMVTTSGAHAVPVMQLFYRLSSIPGGPFIESPNAEILSLEKLVQWLLDEIDLGRPFMARDRSPFGETAILVFMFFTLILRNWNQPSTDCSESRLSGSFDSHMATNSTSSTSSNSQSYVDEQKKSYFASEMLRACDYIRQQAFVNYLMDLMQQLMGVFKSSTVDPGMVHVQSGLGCGSLLMVKRELPVGIFYPFFSDSYVKSHHEDIFGNYYKLLLENAFRLLYNLVRPEKQDRTGKKERHYKTRCAKELKLDGYQDILCSYINNPHTTFVRRYARRLFLHICGSKSNYYSVRDSWQYSTEFKKLHKHVHKSNCFLHNAPYDRGVKVVQCLSNMAEIAASRPCNWQKYCLSNSDVLSFLLRKIFYSGEESVIRILKLLSLAFYTGKDVTSMVMQRNETPEAALNSNKSCRKALESKRKKGEDNSETSTEKSTVDMEPIVAIFAVDQGDVLKQFIDCFLLEWNLGAVRMEAKFVLYGLWHHGNQSFKESMLVVLLQKFKCLPLYGPNIVDYTELLTLLLGKDLGAYSKQGMPELLDRCLSHDVIKCVFDTLHVQNELLANHPNSRIYNILSGVVEFDGYYLENEPCVACSSPEVPYSRMKLESLKSEVKYTDNRIIVKCNGSYTIQTVMMNVHDARKPKSVKVLKLYYNNRPVVDLSELKNNWSLWKRAKSCHLAFNQTELKVDFIIPITACNFMIELDSFYENLQALSLEVLQCPRCSQPVTDKHGICSNCHENAYQCRQCRNINYENLDSFLCNECGYSKYGRFEFNFMTKPSFVYDDMENDDDMKRGLVAIESESENAHRRYQQLLGFKKPLLKIVSTIGENEMDSQQRDTVQQMMVSLPGPSCKISRKFALLGVLYGEKCKAAFDAVSKSVQTLQGIRRVLMNYLCKKYSETSTISSRYVASRSPSACYGCATMFVTQCLEVLLVLSKHPQSKKQCITSGLLSELFENNLHQGPKAVRVQARAVLSAFTDGDVNAVSELNNLIKSRVIYFLEHHRSMDVALSIREELLLLSELCLLTDELWESRLRIVFHLLFSSIRLGSKHPAISEHVILPCLRIISQACTPLRSETSEEDQPVAGPDLVPKENNQSSGTNNKLVPALEKNCDSSHVFPDVHLLSYSEWEKGASYLDFVRRQYKVSQANRGIVQSAHVQKTERLGLKYGLRWKRRASTGAKSDTLKFELGSWVKELVLSPCSQSVRAEMCLLVNLLFSQGSSKRFRLLNLLMDLLPSTIFAGESAAEYFDLLFTIIDAEEARVYLTVRRCLHTICKLIAEEVRNIESLERSLHIDISQGFILHKLIELLGKFLEVSNIRARFMRDGLLSDVLEALIIIQGLIVQRTKLISDCNRLLKELIDGLLLESNENKRQFIGACICSLQVHIEDRKGRTSFFILEQLCNVISPTKPECTYQLILNKSHTQEEFIRGSMTKNPYSSAEIGPLMRDVKNKICQQLDLIGLLEDDYGMELLVAGNIISLDLSIAQVYEQVWKKSNTQSHSNVANPSFLSSFPGFSSGDNPPMTITYRLQGLDGEATEPIIKELEEEREETQDPEVEFAIAGAVQEYGGMEIVLNMIERVWSDLKLNHEHLTTVLKLLILCCKIRENRQSLLKLGALSLLLETSRRAFSVDATDAADSILSIVESLTLEATRAGNIGIPQLTFEAGTGEQAKNIVFIFLERLTHHRTLKKSNKQQRSTEMVARILPYLTYGEPSAMHALIQHFEPFLKTWAEYDCVTNQCIENPKDETVQRVTEYKLALENFVRLSESLNASSFGEKLKDIILDKGITAAAAGHLRDTFGMEISKSNTQWSCGLRSPSVPLIISMLAGLAAGHFGTQRCIDEEGLLPLLHTLEGVSGENEIGAKAENLLDTLSGTLRDKVRSLRLATKDEMKRRALKKREQLLKGLGMRQEVTSDGGERIVISNPVVEGLEDVVEEDGIACMVCREGYSLRPSDLLGVYTYSKRVNLGGTMSVSSRGECVYTTVSHFNVVHFQCHQEAKRADAALKNPKKEWEGATLRNNETLCNSLFPIRGPCVPISQYVRYVDQHWDNLSALGRADSSRVRLLTYDIVLMLARFATGASFSSDSKGGGRESNARFLPFMVQMACHVLDQTGQSQQRSAVAKTVPAYLTSSSPAGADDTVQFMMVSSLLSESYAAWSKHRSMFLMRGIRHAYLQHAHSRSTAGPASPDILHVVQPMLIYTGMIEQMQRFFKLRRPAGAGELGVESGEGWEVVMKEKLVDFTAVASFAKGLLSWLEDITSTTNLQEAFDVIGMLPDVLCRFAQCEDFVHAAITDGKG